MNITVTKVKNGTKRVIKDKNGAIEKTITITKTEGCIR